MRIGDAERELAIEELRRHAAAGRLDHEELEQRVEAALAARTAEDLEPVRADLPREHPAGDDGLGEHVRVFLAVNALLVAIWAVTGMGYFWPMWPILGWGLGVVLHGTCTSGSQGMWPSAKTRRRKRIVSSSSF